MATVAVVFAPGCEEVEGLTVVDVLRRMGIDTKMVGLEGMKVPDVHISGNNQKINEYRQSERIRVTKENRKDLMGD